MGSAIRIDMDAHLSRWHGRARELFPTAVRYSGTSLTFNLAGIFGASLTPYVATSLARRYGLQWVGYYLSTASVLSVVGLLLTRETKHSQL